MGYISYKHVDMPAPTTTVMMRYSETPGPLLAFWTSRFHSSSIDPPQSTSAFMNKTSEQTDRLAIAVTVLRLQALMNRCFNYAVTSTTCVKCTRRQTRNHQNWSRSETLFKIGNASCLSNTSFITRRISRPWSLRCIWSITSQ